MTVQNLDLIKTDKELFIAQAIELLDSTLYPLTALSNLCAYLWSVLPRINWVGFYLLQEDTLHLGPFQGKVACTRIPLGKGVCGTAAVEKCIQLVPDVHAFPGHIACDCASRSEIVIPLQKDGNLIGVLDIDSPELNRFSVAEQSVLEAICHTAEDSLNWERKLL